MHYAYSITVQPSNTLSNPVTTRCKLTTGIIRHVSIQFPRGCHYAVRVQIHTDALQLLPSNPDGFYMADDYVIECDCYYPTEVFGNELIIRAWSHNARYPHTICVYIDLVEPAEYEVLLAPKYLYNATKLLVELLRDMYV